MDFTPPETAREIAELTGQIADKVAVADDTGPDRALWQELGRAGLLGLAAPEPLGGGAGVLETTAVATELGRHLARVPYGAHAVAGVPVLADHAPPVLRQRLPDIVAGQTVLAAAVDEELNADPYRPAVTLTPDGDRQRLDGTKLAVAFAETAGLLLVTATGPDGPAVAVIEPHGPGVSVTATPTTGLLPTCQVDFAAAPVLEVLDGGAATLRRFVDLLLVAQCAEQSGVVAGALAATADYAREREQFDRPIGSFQAVAQRLADGYIDAQGVALTTTQAAWLLAETPDSPETSSALATAKFWAAEAGHRVAHTTVHVHGGVGLDTSHPVHRFFLRAKHNEFTLGNASATLRRLGDILAETPA